MENQEETTSASETNAVVVEKQSSSSDQEEQTTDNSTNNNNNIENSTTKFPTGIIQDGQVFVDPETGLEYCYHGDQQAWLPFVEEAQFENQQSIYHFEETDEMRFERLEKEKALKLREQLEMERKEKKEKRGNIKSMMDQENGEPYQKKRKNDFAPGWHSQFNTSIYISGLPLDEKKVHNQLLIDEFSKCGIIKTDPFTEQPKVKLYRNDDGSLKGDARVTFLKEESIDLAITLFDGASLFGDGSTITVTRAEFTKPENYDANISLEYHNRRKQIKEKENKKLHWGFADDPDVTTETAEPSDRTVILKHMFVPDDFSSNPLFGAELKDEIKPEMEKYGKIEKIKLYPENPDGVVEIRFKTLHAARTCISENHGRLFDGIKLIAYIWDGKERFNVKETKEQEQERLEKYTKEHIEGNKKD
ncbi:RNA binding domain-containing protein [Naegleria gruberi]|uniref:RNA binding domain-containing protein n=1 Tax=Naegleria gruberi TaxID=5762 RepID=D2V070_NAEGR|nr:RNA binding domain-containing protein [Naegleria gruberi]EFC49664.1 RNA binding domain-containing protein [Naegleria gruberi]|eukprot:XP_002682408.1 RNA binding domain-containing protein [Naegleria gruberi strain NEG-M]